MNKINKKRYRKKEQMENCTDLNFAIGFLGDNIGKCGVFMSHKRQKLKKTIQTLIEIKDFLNKDNNELGNRNGL